MKQKPSEINCCYKYATEFALDDEKMRRFVECIKETAKSPTEIMRSATLSKADFGARKRVLGNAGFIAEKPRKGLIGLRSVEDLQCGYDTLPSNCQMAVYARCSMLQKRAVIKEFWQDNEEQPVPCPFCDDIVHCEDNGWCIVPCPHLLFVACDYGWKFQSAGFKAHLGRPSDSKGEVTIDLGDSDGIHEFLRRLRIPGSILLTRDDGHGLGWYGFVSAAHSLQSCTSR